jgi:pimeloyl-ACP methyl ester carboxylesterase
MPWLDGIKLPYNGFQAITQYIAAVATKAIARPAHYVGHDLGGVGLYWLAQTSFRAQMKSLTIISAPHPYAFKRFYGTTEARPRMRYMDSILGSQDVAALQRELLDIGVSNDTSVTDEINVALKATDFVFLRSLYEQIRYSPLQLPPDQSEQTDLQVAIIYSEGDKYFPAWLMEESVHMFGASKTTLRLNGHSHYPHLMETAQVAAFTERYWNAIES